MVSLAVLGYCLLGALVATPQVNAVSCTITEYNANDIRDAIRDCAQIIVRHLNVPAGVTLQLPLRTGTRLVFQGTNTWGYREWRGPLVNISGTNVHIVGNHQERLDAKGYLWWDGLGEHRGTIKPLFFVLHNLVDSVVEDLHIVNSPHNAIWIEDSHNVTVSNVIVGNGRGNDLGGLDTDGIDIFRSHHILLNEIVVSNQGDCVGVRSGTNIVVRRAFCFGGYGLAVGSVGDAGNNVVENVLIENSQILSSSYGVNVRTIYHGAGSVTNVTYRDMSISGISKYGIVIEGDYTPSGQTTGIPTDGVPIKNLFLQNIRGTVVSSGVNIFVLVESASDWYWSGIEVSGGLNHVPCQGVPLGGGAHC